MAEKLTADGYLHGNIDQPYVWLPRAQALADALEACKAERDALRNELASQMKTRTSQPDFATFVELKHGIVGTILAALQDGQISRGKAAEALAEVAHGVEPRLPDDLPDPVSEDVVPSDVLRERDEARAELQKAEARNASQRKANARLQAEYNALNQKYENARQNMIRDVAEERAKRKTAEQREARLRTALDVVKLALDELQQHGRTSVFEILLRRIRALADVPAAPAAEQPKPPSDPYERVFGIKPACPVCDGTRMNATDDGRCRVCTPQGPPPRLDLMQEEPQPAPAALDPALREPLPRGREIVSGACNRMKNSDLLASSKPVTVAIDQVVDEASDRIEKLWRWIDGEPERTKEAIDRRINSMFGPVGSGSNEAESRDRLRLRGFAQVERRLAELENQVADEPQRTPGPVDACEWLMRLRQEIDELAPQQQQGGTEGREK